MSCVQAAALLRSPMPNCRHVPRAHTAARQARSCTTQHRPSAAAGRWAPGTQAAAATPLPPLLTPMQVSAAARSCGCVPAKPSRPSPHHGEVGADGEEVAALEEAGLAHLARHVEAQLVQAEAHHLPQSASTHQRRRQRRNAQVWAAARHALRNALAPELRPPHTHPCWSAAAAGRLALRPPAAATPPPPPERGPQKSLTCTSRWRCALRSRPITMPCGARTRRTHKRGCAWHPPLRSSVNSAPHPQAGGSGGSSSDALR